MASEPVRDHVSDLLARRSSATPTICTARAPARAPQRGPSDGPGRSAKRGVRQFWPVFARCRDAGRSRRAPPGSSRSLVDSPLPSVYWDASFVVLVLVGFGPRGIYSPQLRPHLLDEVRDDRLGDRGRDDGA